MYDQAPDSIVARLGRRDQDLDADNFAMGIDSYLDKQTGFYFSVNPAGSIGDGTINPDFGQVELDPAVVNLSAFETYFEEKRPFFIEGAGIFSFGHREATSNWGFNYGSPDFFYSRRIGRKPQAYPTHEGEANIPANSTILAAAKISGKTKHNWEIAALQAVTAREAADVIDSSGVRFEEDVEPLTSYTILRTFKNFNENRFGLGFLGSSVVRNLHTDNLRNTLRNKAFTGGLDGYVFIGKEKKWALNG